jgi:hypothetical protein
VKIINFITVLVVKFILPVTTLFLFSFFYTDYYSASLFQGDELTYLKLANQMNDNDLSVFERSALSLSTSLNFLWPLILSYVPSLELDGNIMLHISRIVLLVSAYIFFIKTFGISLPVIILMIPFLFQASIYSGTLYRDDVVFSLLLLFMCFIHKNIFSPIALSILFLIIGLRASLGAIVIPVAAVMVFNALTKSEMKTKLYLMCLFLILMMLFIITNQALISYAMNIFKNAPIDIYNFLRPFFSPINPLMVEGEIRYNNPVIFILFYINKIFFLASIIYLLFIKNRAHIEWKIILYSLFFILPYFFFPENLGMRQAIGFQFIMYTIFINAAYKSILGSLYNSNEY